MRKIVALVVVAALGFAAGCGSGKNKSNPTINQPPPQPTNSTQKTGTPSTPANTGRTTTAKKASGQKYGG